MFQRGFSLVELLVALALVAIVASVGIPNLGNFLVANQTTTQANEVISALMFARSEAITRGESVMVNANGGDWSQGWSTWADTNSNGSMDSGEELQVVNHLQNGFSLSAGNQTTQFIYLSTGLLSNNAGDTLQLCGPKSGLEGRSIVVLPSGAARVSTTNC